MDKTTESNLTRRYMMTMTVVLIPHAITLQNNQVNKLLISLFRFRTEHS